MKKPKLNNFAEVREFGVDGKQEISNFETSLNTFQSSFNNYQGNLNSFQANSFTFGYGQENEGRIREESQESCLSFNENAGFVGEKNKCFGKSLQGKKIR